MYLKTRSMFFIVLVYVTTTQQASLYSRKLQDAQLHYPDALEAILGIGVRLQALLEDPAVVTGNNFMVSPLSAALLISQLMLGAEGKFRDQLFNLLSLPTSSEYKNSLIRYHKKNVTYTLPYAQLHLQMRNLVKVLEEKDLSTLFTLNSSNGLFIDTKIKLKEEFRNLLGMYDTDIKQLNFSTDPPGSQKIINEWVSAQTKGLIKTILSSPLPTSASAVFTNAMYFKADWETPFSYETNAKRPFHVSEDKTVEAEYMQSVLEKIHYAESSKLGCKMIALPYKNNELSMYLILPFENSTNRYDLRKFGEKLRTKNLLEFISQTKPHTVTVMIPKMKLTNRISILEPLQRYAAFERTNDIKMEGKNKFDILDQRVNLFSSFDPTETDEIVLSAAADNAQLTVSNVIQEMTLDVNEKGTEAAVVTASIIDYIGGSKNFRVNKPFIFFIRHTQTSTILFWGAISDPTQSQ